MAGTASSASASSLGSSGSSGSGGSSLTAPGSALSQQAQAVQPQSSQSSASSSNSLALPLGAIAAGAGASAPAPGGSARDKKTLHDERLALVPQSDMEKSEEVCCFNAALVVIANLRRQLIARKVLEHERHTLLDKIDYAIANFDRAVARLRRVSPHAALAWVRMLAWPGLFRRSSSWTLISRRPISRYTQHALSLNAQHG